MLVLSIEASVSCHVEQSYHVFDVVMSFYSIIFLLFCVRNKKTIELESCFEHFLHPLSVDFDSMFNCFY